MNGLLSAASRVLETSEFFGFVAAIAGKGTLVILIGVVVCKLLRQSGASARHLVWTATFVGLLFLPAISVLAPRVDLPLLPQLAVDAVDNVTASGLAVPKRTRIAAHLEATDEPLDRTDLSGIVAVIYLTGVLATLAYFATGWVGVWHLTRAAKPSTELQEWQTILTARQKAFHGTGRRPALLTSPSLPAPVHWGFWKPTVLLPAEASGWTARDLRQALLHELAHIERRDWATQLLALLACSLYWFHPLVWLAARQQVLEAERACDDQVLASGAESSQYAGQLLALARGLRVDQTRLPTTVSMAHRSHLKWRIQSILNPQTRRSTMNTRTRRTVFALACLPAILMSPIQLTPAMAHEPSAADSEQVDALLAAAGEGSLLILAARAGDLEATRRLLDAGADVNSAVQGDGNALIVAASIGDTDLLQLLIDRGADVNAAVRGDGNALIVAARDGHLDAVRLLVDNGAEIDRVVPDDENPLIRAAAEGRLEVARYLIDHGADVNARVLANGDEIRTPLRQATRGGHADVVDLLLTAGATD